MPPSLTIEVRDEFQMMSSSGASSRRTLFFANRSDESCDLPLLIPVDLPLSVTEVTVSYDGSVSDVPLIRGLYSIAGNLSLPTTVLAPGETATITLAFTDTAFVPDPDQGRAIVRLRLPFPVTYQAVIRPQHRQRFPNPRLRIEPPVRAGDDYFLADDGRLVVMPRFAPTDTEITVSVSLARSRAPTLPLLEFLANDIAGDAPVLHAPFAGLVVMFIPHLLSDFLSLFDAFVRAGLEPENVFVIGIPYSSKADVVAELKDIGVRGVYAPDSYPFDGLVRSVLNSALAHAAQLGRQLLVIEDGGYVSPLLQEDPVLSRSAAACIGVVEQTRNGIWAYEAALERSAGIPRIRLVSVAEAALKDELEAPLIGETIVRNVENILSRCDESVRGRRVLLLGFGSIGTQVFARLRTLQCEVTVCEQDEARRHSVPSSAVAIAPTELLSHIARNSVVLGTTGREVFDNVAQFRELRNEAILINGSSKRREFSFPVLQKMTRTASLRPRVGRDLTLVTGNRVLLVADGFPVNFFHSESVAGVLIQPVLACLLLASHHVVTENDLPLGKSILQAELQSRIRQLQGELMDRGVGGH